MVGFLLSLISLAIDCSRLSILLFFVPHAPWYPCSCWSIQLHPLLHRSSYLVPLVPSWLFVSPVHSGLSVLVSRQFLFVVGTPAMLSHGYYFLLLIDLNRHCCSSIDSGSSWPTVDPCVYGLTAYGCYSFHRLSSRIT
jgi:hypothetical protein